MLHLSITATNKSFCLIIFFYKCMHKRTADLASLEVAAVVCSDMFCIKIPWSGIYCCNRR